MAFQRWTVDTKTSMWMNWSSLKPYQRLLPAKHHALQRHFPDSSWKSILHFLVYIDHFPDRSFLHELVAVSCDAPQILAGRQISFLFLLDRHSYVESFRNRTPRWKKFLDFHHVGISNTMVMLARSSVAKQLLVYEWELFSMAMLHGVWAWILLGWNTIWDLHSHLVKLRYPASQSLQMQQLHAKAKDHRRLRMTVNHLTSASGSWFACKNWKSGSTRISE